jgi:hypothetical protein
VTAACEDVARPVLGKPSRQARGELLWPCPWHEDKHPSFQVNTKKDCWMCGPCGLSGNCGSWPHVSPMWTQRTSQPLLRGFATMA